jgi:hypothetical protein
VKPALSAIEANPQQYARVRGEIRRAVIRRFPYAILYLAEPDAAVVLGTGKRRRRGLLEAAEAFGAGEYPAGVKIDTRGDGRSDQLLPAPSNFLAGVEPAVLKGEPSRPRL